MKKLFLGLTVFILVVLAGVYGILFTSSGNSYIASVIEQKVNEGQKDVHMKVNDFKLTMKEILFNATLDENSIITVKGDLNLFAQSVDLNYDINVADLSKLQNITKQKLNGSMLTNGTFIGNAKEAYVKGISKIASSETTYDIKLVDFNPDNILFNMKNAKIEQLLNLVDQPIYATGNLDIEANIKSADINALSGVVSTKITNGILNAKLLNQELKENPKTPLTFSANSLTNLKGNDANTKLDLDSTFAKLEVKNANINLKTSVINSDYNLFVKDLTKLESLINQKFNGTFSTRGNVAIDNGVIKVNGSSDIFSSNSTYDMKISNSKPEYINLLVSKAKIESLLKLIDLPNYANGLMNIDAKINSADVNNLDGKVLTTILESTVNNAVINKEFNQKLKEPLVFKGFVATDLVKTEAISKVELNTTVTDLNMEKAVFDISKGEFLSDYAIDFTDLSKLYDLTQQKMRGSAKIAGNIKQGKDLLSVDGKSELFDGNVTFNLLNDDFKAKIDGVEVKSLTHMLYYPEIFTSKSNIDVDYNLASKVGKISGNLLKGQFIENEYSSLINTFAQFDITKEIYEKVEITSDMKQNIINTVIDMKSEHTTIKVPSSTLDTDKNTINALVQSKISTYEFDTKISGDLSNPKVQIDKNAFLDNTKAGKEIKKKTTEIKNKIEKNIQKKLGDKFKLDNLLNKAPTQEKVVPVAANDKKPTNAEIAAAFKAMFGTN